MPQIGRRETLVMVYFSHGAAGRESHVGRVGVQMASNNLERVLFQECDLYSVYNAAVCGSIMPNSIH